MNAKIKFILGAIGGILLFVLGAIAAWLGFRKVSSSGATDTNDVSKLEADVKNNANQLRVDTGIVQQTGNDIAGKVGDIAETSASIARTSDEIASVVRAAEAPVGELADITAGLHKLLDDTTESTASGNKETQRKE